MTSLMLSEHEQTALQTIAQQTGKSEDALVHEAVALLIAQFQVEQRRHFLRQAQGMWHDHIDLPDVATLRTEFDRLES